MMSAARAFVSPALKTSGLFYSSSSVVLRAKKSRGCGEMKSLSHFYKPKTENQEQYVKYLSDMSIPIVLGIGPAGSGKTLFACNQAVMALKRREVDKIILTRPVVPVEEDIGFLPGSMINKMDPWTRPIFDILLEFYAQKDIDGMLHSGVLEISPLGYMRGRTFKDAFIIADEMQNSSPNQMLMMTTRIGSGSKMVITGDLAQSDRGVDNGLADLMRKLDSYNRRCEKANRGLPDIRMVLMKGQDIQRSPIVSTLLDIYSSGEPYSGEPTVPPDAPSSGGPAVPPEPPSLTLEGPKVEPVKEPVVEKPKLDTVVEKPTRALIVRNDDAALIPYPWEASTKRFTDFPR